MNQSQISEPISKKDLLETSIVVGADDEEDEASPKRKEMHLQDHGQSQESQININEAHGLVED